MKDENVVQKEAIEKLENRIKELSNLLSKYKKLEEIVTELKKDLNSIGKK